MGTLSPVVLPGLVGSYLSSALYGEDVSPSGSTPQLSVWRLTGIFVGIALLSLRQFVRRQRNRIFAFYIALSLTVTTTYYVLDTYRLQEELRSLTVTLDPSQRTYTAFTFTPRHPGLGIVRGELCSC